MRILVTPLEMVASNASTDAALFVSDIGAWRTSVNIGVLGSAFVAGGKFLFVPFDISVYKSSYSSEFLDSHNTSAHRAIGYKSPYHVTFGQKPRCGISNLPMDPVFLKKLVTEDDLMKAFNGKVLDDVLCKSTAENKPEDDLMPTPTASSAMKIDAIVEKRIPSS